MAIRADAHKEKIKELEQALNVCKQVMETELLLKICDRSTAIEQQQSQAFAHLERDVQDLILKVASGQTKIEMLVTEEAKLTREVLSTSLATHFKASNTRVITESQRQRLLKSLKPEEIRLRYNEVMSPSDASFERVFASYERVCRNEPEHKSWQNIDKGFSVMEDTVRENEVNRIDDTWYSFSSWLQSDNDLFWIRGKPGSGKSTLMKFIIENDNTARLLDSWRRNTRILSYFLWKIGEESQNSIKGLLCCLLHDLLRDSPEMVDRALERFSSFKSKDYYREWSRQEAAEALYFLLGSQTCTACIFIDGLDEISDKDGFASITSEVERICAIPGVKVCVSSRPETGLVNRLREARAQELGLHDLTRPEMSIYIQKQLARFPKGTITTSLLEDVKLKLLRKAEGVFLWLFLAIRNLETGISNRDDGETLMKRLEELPSELGDLYEMMWTRLNANNKVYQKTAAMYFYCIIADGWHVSVIDVRSGSHNGISRPTLAQLSMVVKGGDDQIFPPRAHGKSLYDLKKLCEATERDLKTRCAGMLEVDKKSIFCSDDRHGNRLQFTPEMYPFTRAVRFIHRTARDFLVDTKPGQDILGYHNGTSPSLDLRLKIFKTELYLSTLYHTIGVLATPNNAIMSCFELQNQGANDDVILQLLLVIQSLCNQGVFIRLWSQRFVSFYSLPARLACELSNMDDFLLPWIMQSSSPQAATVALRDICLEWRVPESKGPPAQIIQRLLALGADPHSVGATSPQTSFPKPNVSFTQETSAFDLLLRGTMNRFFRGDRKVLPALLEVVDIMAMTCPDWHRRIIVTISDNIWGNGRDFELRSWEFCIPFDGWATFEMDMQYLLKWTLAAVASCGIPTCDYNVHDIANSSSTCYSRIRHIEPGDMVYKPTVCRITDHKPFEGLCDNIIRPQESIKMRLLELIDDFFDICEESVYEIVSIEDEVDCLAAEGFPIYRLKDNK